MKLDQLKIISAGAGSGKTFRLTQEMVALLQSGQVKASGIIATTFTRKAAAELKERVRIKLLEEGLHTQADELTNALIGTVHGLGVKLLRRFAFEAGVSPSVDILPDDQQQQMFNQSLAAVLTLELIEDMDRLNDRLGLTKRNSFYDWRREVRQLVDIARANDFSADDLRHSRDQSWQSFRTFLPASDGRKEELAYAELKAAIQDTIHVLENGQDQTKVTATATDKLRASLRELDLRAYLYWYQWAALGKLKVGAKSREAIEPLTTVAWSHQSLSTFQQDIQTYLGYIFDTAIAAIEEFDRYKKSRGLIDYTDMEVLVSRLLDNPAVREVLADELDLLMVDEFQDTSPIQLEIFLKLSQLAPYSVWVGDPKQSIYGFRGAEPRLMDAIVSAAGGVKAENIQTNSWRSREDLVYTSNALFCRAFDHLDESQVALEPIRVTIGNKYVPAEPLEMDHALLHWHIQVEGDRRRPPANPWMEESIARTLKEWLASKVLIQPKGTKEFRYAEPGDVAILCRSNAMCVTVAEALTRAGLSAAIAQAGLLQTAEVRLVLACLKYVLYAEDSLSVAEIQILATRTSLEDIIEDRLIYLDQQQDTPPYQRPPWAGHDRYIRQLDELRPRLAELSSAETLNLLLEELDLRRCVVPWGNSEQRLANLDQLRKLALDYESACNSTHTAASLGGFLLWLNKLAADNKDLQGASEDQQAVNVLTYHRSKGLEWPVVICHNLDNKLRDEVWGFELVAETEEVDLTRVLKGRWLRYWVNPYADQQARTPLSETLTQSDAQVQKRQASLAEEARLLYVGLTRARDYLILPTRMNTPTKWLNRVWSKGEEGIPTLDANDSETPWEWRGKTLTKDTQVFTFPELFPVAEASLQASRFLLAAPANRTVYPEFILTPKEWIKADAAKLGQLTTYATPAPSVEGIDEEVVAQLKQTYLRAAMYLDNVDTKTALAQRMVNQYEIPSDFSTVQLVKQVVAWQQYLAQRLPQSVLQQQVPFSHWENGRKVEVKVDWVLLSNNNHSAILLIDCDYYGDRPRKKAKEYIAYLMAAAQIWQLAHHKDTPVQYGVHFPALGVVVEVLNK